MYSKAGSINILDISSGCSGIFYILKYFCHAESLLRRYMI